MPAIPWTDDTVIPWGAHKGKKLKDLDASYLLWLYEQPWIKDWPGLHLYLKAHEDQLLTEKRDHGGLDDDEEGFKSFDDYKNYRH